MNIHSFFLLIFVSPSKQTFDLLSISEDPDEETIHLYFLRGSIYYNSSNSPTSTTEEGCLSISYTAIIDNSDDRNGMFARDYYSTSENKQQIKRKSLFTQVSLFLYLWTRILCNFIASIFLILLLLYFLALYSLNLATLAKYFPVGTNLLPNPNFRFHHSFNTWIYWIRKNDKRSLSSFLISI